MEVKGRRPGFKDRDTVQVGKRADLILVSGEVTEKLEGLWEDEGLLNVSRDGILAGTVPMSP